MLPKRKIIPPVIYILTWILSIIIPMYLGITLGVEQQSIVLLIVLLLFVMIVIIFVYFHIHLNWKHVENLANSTPTDVITKTQCKIITFYDDVAKNVICDESRILVNTMTGVADTYSKFRYKLRSPHGLPNRNQIEFWVDKEKKNNANIVTKYVCEMICDNICPSFGRGPGNQCRFKEGRLEAIIPVNIGPESSATFRIKYPTHAYYPAYDGVLDYAGLSAQRLTERMEFTLLIADNLKGRYRFVNPEDEGEGHAFVVTDASEEEMANTKRELIEMKNIPIYKPNKVTWVINNPKLGYMYKVNFLLVRI